LADAEQFARIVEEAGWAAFDSVSHARSPQQWVAQRYRPLAVIGGAIAAAGIAVGSYVE
jgi:hypothetical protein